MKPGLLVVDVQNDFLPPSGTLAVLGGLEILPVIMELATLFPQGRRFATQDYHPEDHSSFVDNGGIWPLHCVQDTNGCKINSALEGLFTTIFRKGADKDCDSYSCFKDEKGRVSGTASFLKNSRDIHTLFVCGLATDYCIKETVLDAISEGFQVYVIIDAIEGVDLNPGDVTSAIEEMVAAGATFVKAEDVDNLLNG